MHGKIICSVLLASSFCIAALGVRCEALTPASAGCMSSAAVIGQLAPEPSQLWIELPPWLAGTWEARAELLLSAYDYRQHCHLIDKPVQIPLRRQSVLGTQQDTAGRIWHYIGTPYTRSVETGSYLDLQRCERVVLEYSSETEVRVMTVANVTRFNSAAEITDSFREETTTTYMPLEDGLLKVEFCINDYDTLGRPRFASRALCTFVRTKPFRPLDKDERGDLHRRFQDFIWRQLPWHP